MLRYQRVRSTENMKTVSLIISRLRLLKKEICVQIKTAFFCCISNFPHDHSQSNKNRRRKLRELASYLTICQRFNQNASMGRWHPGIPVHVLLAFTCQFRSRDVNGPDYNEVNSDMIGPGHDHRLIRPVGVPGPYLLIYIISLRRTI